MRKGQGGKGGAKEKMVERQNLMWTRGEKDGFEYEA